MKKIICLIGPSGCGKTTLGSYLKAIDIPEIVSTTTREPRIGEIPNVTYYFVTKEIFDTLTKVEESSYAGNYYCITKEEIEDKFLKSDILYIITNLDGYQQLKAYYGADVVKSIFIQISPEECVLRMLKRKDYLINIQKRIDNFEKDNEFENYQYCDYVLNGDNELATVIFELLCLIKKIKQES